jgi:hypothetical protein
MSTNINVPFRSLFALSLMIVCYSSTAIEQGVDSRPAPSLEGYVGKSVHELIRNSVVKVNLARLLQEKPLPYAAGKAGSTAEEIFNEWMGVPQSEIEKLEGGYLFGEGCRPHSCPEKAFIATDYSGSIFVVGILHHFPHGKKFSDNPVLQFYSEKRSIDELPESIRERITKWRAERKDEWQNAAKKWGPRFNKKIAEEKWN